MNITQTTVKMRYLCRSFAIAFASPFFRKGTPNVRGQTGGLRPQFALSLAVWEVSFSVQQGSWPRSTVFQQRYSLSVQPETCLRDRRPGLGAQDRRALGSRPRHRRPEDQWAAVSSQERTGPRGGEHSFSPQTANRWRLTAASLCFFFLSFPFLLSFLLLCILFFRFPSLSPEYPSLFSCTSPELCFSFSTPAPAYCSSSQPIFLFLFFSSHFTHCGEAYAFPETCSSSQQAQHAQKICLGCPNGSVWLLKIKGICQRT